MTIVEVGTRFEGLADPNRTDPWQQLTERMTSGRLVAQKVVSGHWRAIRSWQLPEIWREFDGTCYFVPIASPGPAYTEVLVRPLLGTSMNFIDDKCFVESYKHEDDLSVIRKEDGRYLLEVYSEPYPPHPYVAEYAGHLSMPAPEAFKEPVYSD